MSRAAYHRAYYHRHADKRRHTARALAKRRRWVKSITRIVCDAVDEARHDS